MATIGIQESRNRDAAILTSLTGKLMEIVLDPHTAQHLETFQTTKVAPALNISSARAK
jgi:hypothetical protein